MRTGNVLRSGGVVARVHAPDYPALAFRPECAQASVLVVEGR
jgi:hypothetical protein